MVQQIEIILKPKRRGFHLVTSEILSQFCGLSINPKFRSTLI